VAGQGRSAAGFGLHGALRRLNTDGTLRRYPGSPALARAYLRATTA